MRYPQKIDLHMHTVVSDGTDTPEEILHHVKDVGIELFSITDHDAVKGCVAMQSLLSDGDPLFITGAEFSCKDEGGYYHILGYGYDPQSKPMQDLVAKGHNFRIVKLQKRLDFIKNEFGFTFSDDDIAALRAKDNPGKPHIAKLMIKYGYADSISHAISTYLNQFHTKSEYVRPEESIRAILAAGGVPILAHPAYGRGDEQIFGDAMDKRLRYLMDFGLCGVEAFYSGFSPKIQAEMLAFAQRYDLLVTAGSDYHGQNKLVRLGDTNLPTKSEYPPGLCRFLERLNLIIA